MGQIGIRLAGDAEQGAASGYRYRRWTDAPGTIHDSAAPDDPATGASAFTFGAPPSILISGIDFEGGALERPWTIASVDWGSDFVRVRLWEPWNTVKRIEIDSFAMGELRYTDQRLVLENWVDAVVNLGSAEEGIALTLDGSKRGRIDTGSGDDRIWVRADSNGGPASANTFTIATRDGDDEVTIEPSVFDWSIRNPAVGGSRLYFPAWTHSVIDTGAGDDRVTGGGGIDRIVLGAGNDRAEGGRGDDIADGGEGTDTWVLPGGRASYEIEEAEGVVTVQPTDGDPEFGSGIDTLTGFERLVFADTVEIIGRRGEIDLADVAAGQGGFAIVLDPRLPSGPSAVTDLADMNGDGVPELALATGGVFGSETNAIHVVFGRGAGRPAVLFALPPNEGFRIDGEAPGDLAGPPESPTDLRDAGADLASAGDWNGDGLGDLLIGAPRADDGAGAAYLVWGQASGTDIDLARVAGGNGGVKFVNAPGGRLAGAHVERIADMNGDGRDEILIGAPGRNQAFIVFGDAFDGPVDLSEVGEGVAGLRIDGPADVDTTDRSGQTVMVRDLNGDGLDELLLTRASSFGESRAWVVFGRAESGVVSTEAIDAGEGGFAIDGDEATGPFPLDSFGATAATMPDLNGDGLDELLFAAPFQDTANGRRTGRVYVVFGQADGTEVDLGAIVRGEGGGFAIDGNSQFGRIGISRLDWSPDLNGDGLPELLIGGGWSSPPDGETAVNAVHVVFGKADAARVDLAEFAAETDQGFRIYAGPSFFPNPEIHALGDLNGDGLAELLVQGEESAFLVFGREGGGPIDVEAFGDGVEGIEFAGAGEAVPIADLDGDGLSEILIADRSSVIDTGGAYVVLSSALADELA